MQNKINLDTHNEVIPVNEPWHRGSGFTWMLLALAGAVFFLSGVAAKAGGDIFDGYIQINGTWYNVGGVNDGRNNPSGSANASGRTLLSSANFGTQNFGGFNLTGFQINGWTSFGTGVDNNGANYRVWRSGDTKPANYMNFYNQTSETWYAGSDYFSSVSSQSTGIIGDTFLNGQTYNLEVQTYTVLTGDNAGSKFYERTGTFIVNGARQEVDISSNANQSGVYNTSVAGGVVKKGSATLTLTENNSNATTGQKGEIYIDAGTVAVNPNNGVTGNQALGGSGAVVRLGATSGSAAAGFALTDSDGGLDVGRQIVVRNGSSGTKTISSSNSSGVNTLSGTITLDHDVTISGASGSGTLNLSGNLEDGAGAGGFGATISAGKVEFSGSSSNTGLTGYTVNSGAELRLNKTSADAVQSILNINSGGTATLVAANQLGSGATVNNSGTLATGGNSDTFGTLNSSGNITGNGTLTAGTYSITGGTVSANLGNGTLTASGNSTINGNTTASTLNVTGDTTLNGTSSATTVAVSGTGTDLNLGSGGNRLSSSADVTVGAGSKLNITSNQTLGSVKETGTSNGGEVNIGSGAKLTINGADKGTLFQNTISGAGDLEMAGTGSTSLALYGTQSYTGNTTVSGGKISTAVALATAGVTVSGGTFETTAADILGNSASVNISSGTYSLGGSDTVGSLTISGGSLTGTSTLTAATYALQGGTVGANLGAGAATASAGTTALNGNLGGSLTASGGTVNAAGTIGGNVTVNGGTVNLSAADRISNTSAVSISSGTLGLGANNDTVGSLSISGGTLGGSGKLTASTYGLSGGTVNANLGAGTVNANSGTTALNGTVDATTINVGGGTLNLGSGGRLAAGATANVSSGTLSTGGNETITRLNATGGTVNLTGDTLTVTGTGGNASSIGSSVTATGGTISVQGALDYQASSGSTALSVASGGTLSGSGTTSGTLSVGGKLAPGNSTGVMNVGSTTFLGGGSYAWEIDTFGSGAVVGTNWDFLNITGSLTISASSGSQFLIDIISLLSTNDTAGPASGFNLASNYSFAIATASGGISGFDVAAFAINTSGFQNSMGAGNPLYVSAGSWSVSQSGNNLMLNYTGATAIPEPSSAALTLIGLGVLALRRRCRR